MAAGKQKRRLNGVRIESFDLLDQHGGKKKKSGSLSQNAVNLRPHISLEWDEVLKKAVARKDQVGITRRDISPFVGSLHQVCSGLADVIAIPRETFALDNLNSILSYEVWQTCLSESERKYLLQFLPRGIDADQVVKPLLMGENLHFGNPLLKWGSSLCSGNLHPDAVLQQELCFKSNKKAYYSELQKYHHDILENLQRWKKRWASCKDPEKDIVQKLWRYPRKNAENSLSSYANEPRQLDMEENLAASADSCSSIGDEKGSSSKKDNILDQMYEKYQERKGSVKCKRISSISAEVNSSTRKPDKPCKRSRRGDPSTYMACIKISRRQHQLVKNIKQCSNGIRFKSLNHLLGDAEELDIQTYRAFEEEERKKLHLHWLQLACRDLPAAFAGRKERQLQRQQWRMSIEHEIVEKKKHIMDEDEDEADLESSLPDPGDNEDDTECLSTATMSPHDHETETEILPTVAINSHIHENDDPFPQPTHQQPLLQVPSLNSSHEPGPTSPESGTNRKSLEEASTAPIQLVANMDSTKEVLKEEPGVSSGREIWPAATETFYHPTGAGSTYRSPSELSLRQPEPVDERGGPLIDLESAILEQPARDNGPLFCYTNQGQDHDQLVEPFLKGQEVLQPYSQDFTGLKQQELQFLAMNRDSTVPNRLPQHFHEQRLHEQRRFREKEIYMNQNLLKNMHGNEKYSNMHGNEKYSNQGLFLPADVPDWSAGDSLRLLPLHTPGTGELLGHQWFPGENRGRTGWSCMEESTCNPGLGDGSNTDASLFNTLPQLNRLPPRSLFDTMGSDPFFPARGISSGCISGDGGVHCQQYVYPNHQLNYMSQPEAATAVFKANNAAWMNVPLERMQHQISGLHDPGMKPFLRSWNQ